MNNNEDLKKLINKFKTIAQKKYIKGTSKHTNAIGLTFENELGKKTDSMYFPDYFGTEIKCTSRFSRYPISLFSVALDGPTYPEINRLIETYGYYDKDYKDKKILFSTLNCKTYNLVNNKYIFKLDIDYNEEKLYLCIYDLNYNIIERKSYIYFDTIYTHLGLKLKRLAIIYGSIKKEQETNYFRYYKMQIYELINKETFINLLENGTINVQLIARISKSGNKQGKYRNKNLLFEIKKEDISKLFKINYLIDYDKNIEKFYS